MFGKEFNQDEDPENKNHLNQDDDEEEDEEEDEDLDEGADEDQDEDEDKPLTIKGLMQNPKLLKKLATAAGLKVSNADAAARRVSGRQGNQSPQGRKDFISRDEFEAWRNGQDATERKRQFGYDHQLSPKEVDIAFSLNGGKRPKASFLKEPHVKGAIDALRATGSQAANTPRGTGKPFVSEQGKSFTEMDDKEKQGSFGDRRREILAGMKNR